MKRWIKDIYLYNNEICHLSNCYVDYFGRLTYKRSTIRDSMFLDREEEPNTPLIDWIKFETSKLHERYGK